MKVEVAFNTEGRNITCTVLSSWKCNWSFPSKQPSQQALCKASNNFPGAPELPAHIPNTNFPLMDSRVSQRQILSESTQAGVRDGSRGGSKACRAAPRPQAHKAPTTAAEQVQWGFPGWPNSPGCQASPQQWGRVLGKWGKVWVKIARHRTRARVCTSVLSHGCFPQPFLTHSLAKASAVLS